MRKRLIPLLFVMAVAFVAVPEAEACYECRYFPDYSYCDWWHYPYGWTDCVTTAEDGCVLQGELCNGQVAALTPLASEYAVASVERIDEPQTPAPALVASITVEAPQR